MNTRCSSFIEVLEARIAPAVVFTTYIDGDGDEVTITAESSAGPATLQAALDAATSFSLNGSGLQLDSLDLSDPAFDGAKIRIKADRDGGDGDGFAAVGQILTGSRNLESIVVDGDLGRFDIETLGTLKVRSLGNYGMTTGAESLASDINIGLGSLIVRGDIVDVSISSGDGGISTITLGGSLLGGDAANSGRIDVIFIDTMTVGGNIEAGLGNKSGQISTVFGIDSLKIAGSLIGKKDFNFDDGAQISVGGDLGVLKVGGDIKSSGTNGYGDGQVFADGTIEKLKVNGSLIGRSSGQGSVIGNEGIDLAIIGGDVRNGGGAAGTISSPEGKIQSLTINGDVLGGSIRGEALGSVFIGGDLVGGSNQFTGVITTSTDATVKSIYIAGSLVGGNAIITGNIDLEPAQLTNLFIGGDVQSTLANTGSIGAGNLVNATIGGNILASTTPDTAVTQISVSGLGQLLVGGNIIGNTENIARIQLGSSPAESVKVLGRVDHASLYMTSSNSTLGKIKVGGDWIASGLAVGATAGPDTIFGTGDDIIQAGTSSIGVVKIKGQALGSPEEGDSFRIISRTIGALTVGAETYAFGPGAQTQFLGFGSDFAVVDQA